MNTDIFLWANQTDAVKNDLNVELFLFNKNYTPYSTNFSSDLNRQIKPLFLFDYINFVNLGGGTGLSVRDYELNGEEQNTLLTTTLEKVGRAETLLHLIENSRNDIVEFSDEEHEFKRIAGIIARFTHKDGSDNPFYVVKAIQQNSIVSGATGWEFRAGRFGAFQANAALKMPADNQVLIVDQDIFIFNRNKFEKLFKYDFVRNSQAMAKGDEISKQFKLSTPDLFSDISFMCQPYPYLVKKLIECDPTLMTQEQVIQIIDDMEIELMTDDEGAIILMDQHDAGTFLDILNDNYLKSMTGNTYISKSKKPYQPEHDR